MSSKPSDRFRALLQAGPLYACEEFNRADSIALALVLSMDGLRVDLYCPGCTANSTFALEPIAVHILPGPYLSDTEVLGFESAVRLLTMKCARNAEHVAKFCSEVRFLLKDEKMVDRLTIQKIGQLPSVADLEAARFREYNGLIDKEDLAELRKAAGLAAHGVGIGAFVYLRRIFERLIESAREAAGPEQPQLTSVVVNHNLFKTLP